MGRKAIGRMAAGACSICLCYGMVVQAVQGQPNTVEPSTDTVLLGQSLVLEEEPSTADRFSEENPSVEEEQEQRFDYEVPNHHGLGGRRHRWQEGGDSDGWEPQHQEPDDKEPSDTEEEEDKKKKSEEQQKSSDSEQNSSASGDPPSLNQFLSALRCGGCGHNCSLLNPRCMRGRSKAERAQTEYAQTYGSDSK